MADMTCLKVSVYVMSAVPVPHVDMRHPEHIKSCVTTNCESTAGLCEIRLTKKTDYTLYRKVERQGRGRQEQHSIT